MLGSLRELIRSDRDRAPAIVVTDLTETYRLYSDRPHGLKERLSNPFRTASYTQFNALENVGFTVQHGESIGIVGHNGSGKSTLLKVLARILPPDRGSVEINGRVASLLELGAGFHGDLTGRENVYLNAAILGLTSREVDGKFDAIVEFAGVRDFIDQPVRNFSSGMYVRLGFAIAVHVDPDILLVDEVLSVGDAAFQARSLARMANFQERGKTVVMVSHDLNAIQALCERVLVLDHGSLVFDGPTREGVRLYAQSMDTPLPEPEDDGAAIPGREGSGQVRVVGAQLLDLHTEEPVQRVPPSSQLALRIRLRAERDVDGCSVGARFFNSNDEDTLLYEVHTTWQGLGVGPLRAGDTATVDVRFTAHVLAGHYQVTALVTAANGGAVIDVQPDPLAFEITPAPGGVGLVDFVASTAVVEGPPLRLDAHARAEAASGAAADAVDAVPGSTSVKPEATETGAESAEARLGRQAREADLGRQAREADLGRQAREADLGERTELV